jgi:hypothetical protein
MAYTHEPREEDEGILAAPGYVQFKQSGNFDILLALRAVAAVTHAAGLGGKRFIDFIKPHACIRAFLQQHGSKCAPARIEHRLGQSGLSQSRGIHVADEDRTVGLDQTGAHGGSALSVNAAKVLTPRSIPRLGTARSRIDLTDGLFLSSPARCARGTQTFRCQRPRLSSLKLPARSSKAGVSRGEIG